jgi:hypothetical protein
MKDEKEKGGERKRTRKTDWKSKPSLFGDRILVSTKVAAVHKALGPGTK